MRVRFRSEAVEDVVGAQTWYDEQRDGLGNAFAASLEEVIQLLTEFPRIDRDVIDVVACLHTSRAPGVWRSR